MSCEHPSWRQGVRAGRRHEPLGYPVLDVVDTVGERSDLFGFWAAIERATGRFLGWFHFRPADGHGDDEPELGYRLIASVWGRGLATEGAIALIDHGFSTGRIRRVLAETMAVNVGSRRVMEKAGMRLVRTFYAEWPVRIPGDEEGDVEYAITRDEWQASRS